METSSAAMLESAVPERSGHSEYILTDRDFRFIVKLVADYAGIVLSEAKRDLVYGRLTRRLRALKLRRFSDYCDILANGDGAEMEHFINALTTNLTSFFREQHHFEYLQNQLLPTLLKKKQSKTLRIWSAGCSTGEEAYSIAIAVAEVVPANWDVRILATDLDSNVLATGQNGIYGIERVQGLSESRLKKWFHRGTGGNSGKVKVRDELRQQVLFRQLNLLSSWPMKESFDVIFCRNVVIYFDKPTQVTLFDRFARQLDTEGHLFIGHSETLYRVCDRFALLGNTIYQRVK